MGRFAVSRAHSWMFLSLILFTLLSWISYPLFVKTPGNLTLHPWFPVIFGYSFKVFAQLHVVLSFAVLVLLLAPHANWRWVAALASSYVIALSAELGGTTVGIPFGLYEYTELLGPKLFGHVPVLIPLSWFLVAACAYGMASHLFSTMWARIVFGAALVTAWDFSLDPAMSHMFPYWIWHSQGNWYYGTPWVNFAGWFLTAALIMASFEAIGLVEDARRVPVAQWLLHYALFVILGFGFVALGGLWRAVAVTLFSYTILGQCAWYKLVRRHPIEVESR